MLEILIKSSYFINIYEKRKIEIRFSQLFIKPDSSKQDLGYSKAQMLMDKIKAGEKFEDGKEAAQQGILEEGMVDMTPLVLGAQNLHSLIR